MENIEDRALHFHLFWTIFVQHYCVISFQDVTNALNEPSFMGRESI